MNRNQAQIWLYSEGGVGHCHLADPICGETLAVSLEALCSKYQCDERHVELAQIIRYSCEVGDVAHPLFDLHDGIYPGRKIAAADCSVR